jgi:4-hydroxy-tetrahydrodipicolinate synthase
VAQGVDGVVVNGTTGESPNLGSDEVERLYRIVRREAPALPVIVGTGSNSTEDSIERTREACAWGADAVLVVVPYYNRPPQRGMLQHFTAIADASKAPVILYNVPSRTSAALETATIAKLAEHPRIAAIKEASGNMEFLEDIQRVVPKDFVLLSGDDLSSVEFCARGGHGVISVSSHLIGAEMKASIQRARSGDKHAISEYVAKYSTFMKYLYIEANPIPVKAALFWRKIFTSMELRLPLVALDEKWHGEFKQCLAALGKI